TEFAMKRRKEPKPFSIWSDTSHPRLYSFARPSGGEGFGSLRRFMANSVLHCRHSRLAPQGGQPDAAPPHCKSGLPSTSFSSNGGGGETDEHFVSAEDDGYCKSGSPRISALLVLEPPPTFLDAVASVWLPKTLELDGPILATTNGRYPEG